MADPLDQLQTDLNAGAVFGETGNGSDWEDLYQTAGKDTGISPLVLKALIQQESNFNPKAVGPVVTVDGKKQTAKGPAQLMDSTAAELGVTDPFDPKQAIPAAARYLRQNLDLYRGDLPKALQAYNAGRNPKKWVPSYATDVYDKYLSHGGKPENFQPVIPVKPPVLPKPVTMAGADEPTASNGLFGDLIDQIPGTSPGKAPPEELKTLKDPFQPGRVYDKTPVAQPTELGRSSSGATWGDVQNLASGAIFGQGPRVSAVAAAGKQALADVKNGANPWDAIGGAIHQYYPQALDSFNAARADYLKKNPAGGFVTDVVGSAPTTALLTELTGGLLGGGLSKLGAEFPELGRALRPVGQFLAGAAGQSAGKGGLIARTGNQLLSVASKGARGAEEAAFASAVNQGLSSGSLGSDLEQSGALGGVIGAIGGPLSRAMTQRLRVPINEEVAKLATRLDALGVKLPVGVLARDKVPGVKGPALGPQEAGLEQLNQHTAAVA